MEGRLILRKDGKPNEYGEYPVVIQYCTQGKAVRKSSDIKVAPEHWLDGKGGLHKYIKGGKDGHPKAELLNNKLRKFKETHDKMIDEHLGDGNKIITEAALRAILNGTYQQHKETQEGKVPFIPFVLEHNEGLYKTDKIGVSVWMNVKSYMNKFDKFLRTIKRLNTNENNVLYCRDIDVDLINDYIIWRKEVEGNSNATINKALSPIIKTVKVCCRKGWISREECEEISDLYLNAEGKSVDDSIEKEFLTIEQLRKFKEIVGKVKHQRTREIADIFLFACFAGLRMSDLMTLKWSEIDIDKGMISHMQYKGHNRRAKMLYIPLNDTSREILERWNGRYEDFVFGLLPSGYDLSDDADFIKVKNTKDRTINQSLKSIGDKMGLPFNLHIHLGRHTYAMMALNGGVDIKTTSSMLGHASTMVTEKVYATLLPNTIAEIVGDKLNVQLD
jgi:integrase